MTGPRAAWLTATTLALATVAGIAIEARAHEAKTGWQYDAACCHDRDCHHIPPAEMTATGWRVRLMPGDHPMMGDAAIDQIIPFGNARVSGDTEFHACILPYDRTRVFCLYVPAGGMS